jgi:hypothetical protein
MWKIPRPLGTTAIASAGSRGYALGTMDTRITTSNDSASLTSAVGGGAVAGADSTSVSFGGLGNGSDSANLSAEVEPQARGLSAAQHGDRVLEQLVADAA